MTKTLLERGAEPTPVVERNARLSRFLRAKRPLPATRREADEIWRPHTGNVPARGTRLHRANVLGLLHPEGRPLTALEVHEAILDAIYGPEPHEQADGGDGV